MRKIPEILQENEKGQFLRMFSALSPDPLPVALSPDHLPGALSPDPLPGALPLDIIDVKKRFRKKIKHVKNVKNVTEI